MKELLSNEEIDTLMEMFRSEESELELEGVPAFAAEMAGEAVERDVLISPVDLLKPNRLSREQMQELDRMFEAAAKSVGATMSDRLRYEMHCDCVAVEQIRFGNWLQLVGNNSAVYLLSASNIDTPLFFSVTTNLLYGSVDRVLGGSGRVQDVPKEFSSAEFVVADAFLEPLFQRIAAAMDNLIQGEFSVADRFTNTSRAHVLPTQDVVLSVHLQTGGEFLLGDLRLAIPYASIEPFLPSLGTGPGKFKQSPGELRVKLSETVKPIEVEFGVELGRTQLSLKNLMSLQAGDVVPLQRRVGEPLLAPVQGVPKFHGQVGTIGRRMAFQISKVLA